MNRYDFQILTTYYEGFGSSLYFIFPYLHDVMIKIGLIINTMKKRNTKLKLSTHKQEAKRTKTTKREDPYPF